MLWVREREFETCYKALMGGAFCIELFFFWRSHGFYSFYIGKNRIFYYIGGNRKPCFSTCDGNEKKIENDNVSKGTRKMHNVTVKVASPPAKERFFRAQSIRRNKRSVSRKIFSMDDFSWTKNICRRRKSQTWVIDVVDELGLTSFGEDTRGRFLSSNYTCVAKLQLQQVIMTITKYLVLKSDVGYADSKQKKWYC